MKRPALLLLALGLVLFAGSAFAQKKPAAKKQLPIMIEEMFKGTRYVLVPIEVIFSENHDYLQNMWPEKYTFFFVVIDNRRGTEPVTFNPKRGDVTLIMENNSRRVMVDLTNSMKDPSLEGKISQAFKEAYVPIEVPAGEMKHTLACFSPFNIGDIRSALWSFPGENKNMKPKRLTPSDVKRFKLEPVGGEKKGK